MFSTSVSSMKKAKSIQPFRLQRYFSLSALAATLIALILLTLLYREMFENEIIAIGERNNLTLAKTALNNVKPELIKYLDSVESITGRNKKIPPLPQSLKQAIIDSMTEINAIRINIYNQNGIIIFSTTPNVIGQNESDNPRFNFAINGRIASKLFYHDNLNIFSEEDEYDNLIETYMPIRSSNASTITGVFEIYTDVSIMIAHAEHARLLTIVGVTVIMFLLYSFQVFIVRRAANVITEQQETLRERSRTLEVLSAQLMNADENDRKRIANDLHEDVAQTLTAAKLYLERAKHIQSSSDSQIDAEPLERTISILQDAIQDVRTLAMELRPTTLDEFGIVKTIDWICREFSNEYNKISLDANIEVEEEEIPSALKTIIYRVIRDGLDSIGEQELATKVSLRVSRHENNLILCIEDNAVAYHPERDDRNSEQNVALATIKERVILTGGIFKVTSNRQGGTIMTAEWPC